MLAEYANTPVDVLKVIKLVLVHDLVEIDAGDTYAYDTKGNETKRSRELAAADRLFNILPKDQAAQLRALWDEFEAQESAEARFAHTLDKCQPVLLNDASGGRSWREHGVRLGSRYLSATRARRKAPKRFGDYTKKCIERNIENGNIG